MEMPNRVSATPVTMPTVRFFTRLANRANDRIQTVLHAHFRKCAYRKLSPVCQTKVAQHAGGQF